MGFSMSFNKLNKVMAVATVLATVSCFAPKSAEAARFSGSPNCDVFDFTLDNSGTIQDSVYILKDQSDCSSKFVFKFDSEKLTPSPISGSDVKNFNLPNKFKNGNKYISKLSGRETISLEPVSLKLGFFLSPAISNSVADLIQFLEHQESGDSDSFISGVIFVSGNLEKIGLDDQDIQRLKSFQRFEASFEVIPEPSATGTLLGIGFLGAALLLKRSKYSR